MKGFVRNIIPISPVDGPGNRTVIFLQGCNFNCHYCHNPETIEIVKNETDDIKLIDSDEILNKVISQKSFIRGVTISGGECTVQFQYLIELLKKFKDNNISAYIDTNGHFNSKQREELVEYGDMFMIDIKAFDNEQHIELTGVSNEKVIDNTIELLKLGKLYEIRTVVVPDIIDNIETVSMVSELIGKYDKNVRYKLIKFRNHGVREKMKNISSPTDDYMIKLKGIAESKGLKNIIIV